MPLTYQQVLASIVELMTGLAGDWEYDGPIEATTRLFGQLGLESLDLVVLGTAIQEQYGVLPFAEYFAAIGERPERDVTVGELADFVHRQSARAGSSGTSRWSSAPVGQEAEG